MSTGILPAEPAEKPRQFPVSRLYNPTPQIGASVSRAHVLLRASVDIRGEVRAASSRMSGRVCLSIRICLI